MCFWYIEHRVCLIAWLLHLFLRESLFGYWYCSYLTKQEQIGQIALCKTYTYVIVKKIDKDKLHTWCYVSQ